MYVNTCRLLTSHTDAIKTNQACKVLDVVYMYLFSAPRQCKVEKGIDSRIQLIWRVHVHVRVCKYIHKHVLAGYTPVRVATGLVTAVDRQGGNHITTCSDAAYDSGGGRI